MKFSFLWIQAKSITKISQYWKMQKIKKYKVIILDGKEQTTSEHESFFPTIFMTLLFSSSIRNKLAVILLSWTPCSRPRLSSCMSLRSMITSIWPTKQTNRPGLFIENLIIQGRVSIEVFPPVRETDLYNPQYHGLPLDNSAKQLV